MRVQYVWCNIEHEEEEDTIEIYPEEHLDIHILLMLLQSYGWCNVKCSLGEKWCTQNQLLLFTRAVKVIVNHLTLPLHFCWDRIAILNKKFQPQTPLKNQSFAILLSWEKLLKLSETLSTTNS